MDNENKSQELLPAQTQNLTQSQEQMFVFSSQANFENAQRMAGALAASTIVPAQFQRAKTPEAVANCIIALEMANRIGMSPLMVMQNLYVVNGNVGWSSKFLIAAINTCGRFSPLRYEHENENTEQWRCRAWAIDRTTNTPLHGAWVSMQMAKEEGWYGKSGSKWKTMPELMLQYRAAAFFQRVYAPEISMGMQTAEEITDIMDTTYEDVTDRRSPGVFDSSKIETDSDINAALLRGQINKKEAEELRKFIIKKKAQETVAASAEKHNADLFPKDISHE